MSYKEVMISTIWSTAAVRGLQPCRRQSTRNYNTCQLQYKFRYSRYDQRRSADSAHANMTTGKERLEFEIKKFWDQNSTSTEFPRNKGPNLDGFLLSFPNNLVSQKQEGCLPASRNILLLSSKALEGVKSNGTHTVPNLKSYGGQGTQDWLVYAPHHTK